MARPKVHIISRIFAPEPAAASLRLSALRRGLAAAGARVRVTTADVPDYLTSYDAGQGDMRGLVDERAESEAERGIARVPVIRDANGYVRGYIPYLSFDLQAFARMLTAPAPDVFVVEPPPTTGFFARIAAAIRRRPYVWYAADIWSDAAASTGAADLVVRVLRLVETFVISGAAGVIAVSDDVAHRVRELGALHVDVAFNGANTEIFNLDVSVLSDVELAAYGVRSPFFIYAGNASEWHGADVFARGFEQYWEKNQRVQLVFIGRVAVPEILEISERLAHSARHHQLDYEPIVILDNLPPEQAARWQRTAIGALASVKPGAGYDFAYATKVLSALACGTPVIYSGVGLARADIEENGLGLAVDYSPSAVADAFDSVVSADDSADEEARRADWVRANRSIERTGANAAAAVLAALGRTRPVGQKP